MIFPKSKKRFIFETKYENRNHEKGNGTTTVNRRDVIVGQTETRTIVSRAKEKINDLTREDSKDYKG